MPTKSTHRILQALTGKETFRLVTQSYLERLQGKEPTFSDAELDRSLTSLNSRPPEYRDYYHWCEAQPVIDTLQAEYRVAAMESIWRLSIMVGLLHSCLHTPADQQPQHKHYSKFQSLGQKAQETVAETARLAALLEGFGEVLTLDLPMLICRERRLLDIHLDLYARMAESVEDSVLSADDSAELLPRITSPPASREAVIQAIESAKYGDWWEVAGQIYGEWSQPTTCAPV